MPPLIYIETSVPSYYFETRDFHEFVARRNWTRRWWDNPEEGKQRVISPAVILELERAPSPKRDRCLELLAELTLLPYTRQVAEMIETYQRQLVMPAGSSADADHLALATFHRWEMLVTWNCRHLANARKLAHIQKINALLGYATPQLVTPLHFLRQSE